MENKKLELKQLQKEVVEFYSKLEKELDINIFYKIFFSKFSENADILFIGINPGAGEQVKFTEEEEKFEYLMGYNYPLSKDTKKVFELIADDYPNLLEKLNNENKIVKTNFFYYVDKEVENGENVKINEFKDKVLHKNLREEFYKKSFGWTYKMIELTNPKIIICEGKSAFDNVNVCIPEKEISRIVNEDVFVVKYEKLPFTLLKYNRSHPSSGIKNKEKLAEILKIELDKIYN